MAQTAGSHLGPYEILSALGAGGMGEVYRARDTKLNRDVAIKVLLPAVANDPDRLARFSREAQVLASLNHPNIAHIYGIEDADGVKALVLELVEGEDLAQRIARGPIPLDEALPIARQIADALEAAHEQGIIHRDLKPANIKVRPDGTVKVLDFGLAKAMDPAGGSSANAMNSPTLSMHATQAGIILGTAAYMSPEQAAGKAVDKRSDLWAFGVVLLEMLTGRQVFAGETVAHVLAAVLRAEPDWSGLPESVPPSVRILLRRCLQKDKTLRLQAAGDARVQIHETLSGPETMEPAGAPRAAPGLGSRGVLWGVSGLLVGGIVAGLAVWTLKPVPQQPVTRLVAPLPSGERLPALDTPTLALSPDGSRIAFVSASEGGRQIYVRALDSTESKAIPGTEGAESPFFSPDGNWLGFAAGGNLLKVSLAGGTPLTICKAANPRGVSWGDNDTIIFAPGFGSEGLSHVSAAGGKPEAFTSKEAAAEDEAHRWPQVLPGGRAVLFTAWSRNIDDAQIVVQRLDTRERRVVLRGGTYARYVRNGQLVYASAGTLMAVPFDLARLETTGKPIPVAQGVSLTTEGAAQFDVSQTGSLVYLPGDVQGTGRRLFWVDRGGTEHPLDAPPRNYLSPRISPDGQRVAVAVQGANDDVWVYDIPHQTLSRLTFGSRSLSPIWTSDGKRIIYRSIRNGALNLFARAADGSGEEERLTTSQNNQFPLAESPDGQTLVFMDTGDRDLWILPLTGDRKPHPFFKSPFAETGGAFSPDGQWLAYASDESGRNEVYVQPFPAGGRKVQISRDGGGQPRWARTGELFYLNSDTVMAVQLTTQPTLTVGESRLAFKGQFATGGGSSYDVRSDGQALLMIKEGDHTAAAAQINVVLNWFDELKRLVQTKR